MHGHGRTWRLTKTCAVLDGLAGRARLPTIAGPAGPFAENCGFTIAESAQMVVLFDDRTGDGIRAQPFYAAATDVFVNADGHKKSISGPGVGNYITMAKAVAAARSIVGEEGVRRGGLVQAHGTGTPQNRTSESEILSRTAEAFGIQDWPVAAIKCYLGHSLGSASGDQFNATLGIWGHGIIPGIDTIEQLAEDVQRDRLDFALRHRALEPEEQQYAIINSKGFGGNNASATLLSPSVTARMLQARYSDQEWTAWQRANEDVQARQQAYDDDMVSGTREPVYKFDHGVLLDGDVELGAGRMLVGGKVVDLDFESPYPDMQI